jgi:Kef-type K+ transport system membrane component KefB
VRFAAPLTVLAASLLLAAPALASDNGEGVVGETDDRLITFFALGVVVFFALVVVLGSLLQAALERRKEQRRALELRRRIGW